MASDGEVARENILTKRNQAVAAALCRRFSLDPQTIATKYTGANGIIDLFSNILQLLGDEAPPKNNEVTTWVAFADSFPVDSEASKESLYRLNEDLTQKSVLLGHGLTPSEADTIVFSALHSFVTLLSVTDREKYCNVLRWMDYIQNKEDLGESFEKIAVNKTPFEPQDSKRIAKVEADPTSKKIEQISRQVEKLELNSSSKKSDKLEVKSNSKKNAAEKKTAGDSKAAQEKEKVPDKEPVEKSAEASVSLLNIQVGLIRKAWKHPSADSLLVEEIDLGDGNVRQVVSGLAKYFSPDELINRQVVLITNVKPGKLRDVTSAGLVLCASNQDHTVVEPLLPPGGAKPGERVSFAGHEGKPEDVLNPKKKQLDKITPYLHTDDKGVATFNGIPFMTSAGPCTSSIPNASIK